MEKTTVEFEIDIEMDCVYDKSELEKVLKNKLVGHSQRKSKKGYTFNIVDVREI